MRKSVGSLVLLLILFSSLPVWAATYWVSKSSTGDGNACQNSSTPLTTTARLTISAGIGCLAAGDTLMIRQGTYGEAVTNFPVNGTSFSNAITVRGAAGETVIVSRMSLSPESPNKYLILQDLIIEATGQNTGIHMLTSGHVRLQNVEVRNAQDNGILGSGDFNEFLNVNSHGNGCCPAEGHPNGHGGYFGGNGTVVDGGSWHDNYGHGFQLYGGGGSYTPTDVVVKNTTAHHNISAGIGIYNANGAQAFNNVSYSNGGGMKTSGINGKYFNNTVYGNSNEGIYLSGGVNEEWRNNIAYATSSPFVLAGNSGTTFSNNLCTSLSPSAACQVQGNPNFQNADAGQFQLTSTSTAAINQGTCTGAPSTDAAGAARPSGGGCDIGAYEFVSSGGGGGPFTYYVAASGGSDSRTCAQATNSGTPRQTITSGLTCLSPGDTLIVKNGVYNESLDNAIPGGTASQRVTVKAENSRGATIRGSSGSTVVRFGNTSASHITIEGFIIDASVVQGQGFYLNESGAPNWSTNITIKNCEIFGAGNGHAIIMAHPQGAENGTFFQILDSDLHDNGLNCQNYSHPNCGGNCKNYCHGIYMGSSDNLVDNTKVHHNSAHGIQSYVSGQGPSRNVIKNSEWYNNGTTGLGIYFGSGNEAVNNVVYENGSGITAVSSGVKVYFNTVTNNGPGIDCRFSASGDFNASIKDNIVFDNSSGNITECQGSGTAANTARNLCNSAGGSCALGGNPLLTSTYHLSAGSPAIGAGVAISGYGTDKAGTPRNSPPDLGAYTFGAPPAAVNFTFTASTPVVSGTPSTLTWSAPTGGATSCTASMVSGTDANWTGTTSSQLLAGGSKTGANLTAAATYRMSCTSGGTPLTVDRAVTLDTTPLTFDFALERFAPILTVPQGSSGQQILNGSLLMGAPQDVALSATGLPTGVSVSFQDATLRFDRAGGHPPYGSTYSVQILVGASTPVGSYPITLIGTGGGVSRQTTFTLMVTAVSGTNIYYVAKTGLDTNPGSSPSPWLTIQKALNTVVAGDTVVVRAGTYQERLTVQTSGTSTQPIRLIGESGAIINGAQTVTGWSPAGGFTTGVYQKSLASIGFMPGAITWQGRYEVFIQTNDPDPTPGNDIGTAQELIERPLSHPFWGSAGAIGFGDGTNAYLRFNTNQDPDAESFQLAPVNIPTIDLNAKDWNIIQGFTIRNGWVQVYLHNGADNNIIEHNTMLGGQYNVLNYDSLNNTIRHNQMTLNYYDLDHGHPINTSANGYEVYIYLRKYMGGHNKHGGIVLESAHGTTFAYNHIYRHFSGMNLLGGSDLGEALSNQFRMYNNAIHHVDGYSLEAKNFGDYSSVHDNLFYENTENARIDYILGTGSVYYYRNRHGVLTQSTCCCAYDGKCTPASNDMEIPGTTGNLYMYHNSYNGYISIFWYGAVPNSFWVNNIFSPHHCMLSFASPNLHFANSWLGGEDASSPGGYLNPENTVVANNQRMWDPVNPSWRPSAAAQHIGLNLSQPWVVDGITTPALEGMSPGYFTGSAPDAGAPPAVVTSVAPNPELMARYHADGNATDSGPHGFHGTLTNGALANGAPIVGGQSFVFDGVNDYVNVPGNTTLRSPAFGVALWMNSTTPPVDEACHAIRLGDAWAMGWEQDGRAYCWVNFGPTATMPIGTSVLTGTNQMLACAYDPAAPSPMVRLWQGSELVAYTVTSAPLSYSGSENLTIGGNPAGGYNCAARIDEVSLANYAWAQSDIDAMFGGTTPSPGMSQSHSRYTVAHSAEGNWIGAVDTDQTTLLTTPWGWRWSLKNASGAPFTGHLRPYCRVNHLGVWGSWTELTNSFGSFGLRYLTDSAVSVGSPTQALLPLDGFAGVPGKFLAAPVDLTSPYDVGQQLTIPNNAQADQEIRVEASSPVVAGDLVQCQPRDPAGAVLTGGYGPGDVNVRTMTLQGLGPAATVREGGVTQGGTLQ